MAFQEMFPMATIGYILALLPGLIAEGHEILASQHDILCASARAPTPPVRPLRSILDRYMVVGFASSRGSALSQLTTTISLSLQSGFLCSPLVSRGWERDSSTVLAPPQRPGIPPVEHPTSRCPDPEGLDDSFIDYHGGSQSHYGGSFSCYGGSGFPSSLRSGYYSSGHPFQHHGGSYSQAVPPFVFPSCFSLTRDCRLHAAALVASSLGGTVAPLSFLLLPTQPPPLASDITMSFSKFGVNQQDFGLVPVNSLTPKSVPVGTKNSRSEGF